MRILNIILLTSFAMINIVSSAYANGSIFCAKYEERNLVEVEPGEDIKNELLKLATVYFQHAPDKSFYPIDFWAKEKNPDGRTKDVHYYCKVYRKS